MSVLIENNLHVIKIIKAIEKKAQSSFAQEGDTEANKAKFMDLIENTVRIIQHLQQVRDPDLVVGKEVCVDQLLPVISDLRLKSTTYFMTLYQSILNGRYKNIGI